MSDDQDRYELEIDGWTPGSLPMDRLALYLAEFAKLLGSSTSVHLTEIAKGSVRAVVGVDRAGREGPRSRVRSLQDGTATKDTIRAATALDKLFEDDGTSGRLRTGEDNVVAIDFLGKKRIRPLRYGPFRQAGSLDGVVTKIGGFDSSVPVWLTDGEDVHRCTTTIEVSKELAKHYLEEPVRVHGTARWIRDENGAWTLDKFEVESFEVLDSEPLAAVVGRLRSIKGSDWSGVDDPLDVAARLRREH